MSSAAKVLEVARAEIGYKESPSGSNKTKYGKAYGMDGVPWCAEFVWWVFRQAGCPELFFGGKKSAYCPTIADYYIAKKQTVSKSKGQAGDIVLFDFNQNNSSDHIGIIEKKNNDGTYTCIEGNTAVGNNSNGGQVMRRTRYQSQISWICRPKYTEKSTTTTTTEKKQVVYISPSEHGVNNNKCLKSGCYEDKHTRPIAEECAKHLEASGLMPIIAAKGTTLKERCEESNKNKAVLHVPIHTNADDNEKTRYLMFMFYADTATYRDIFNDVAPYLEAIYPNKKKAVFDVRKDLTEIKTPNAKTLYCELGFHTNKTDVDEFIHEYKAIGKALAQGICKNLGVTFKSATSSTNTSTSTSTITKPSTTKVNKLAEDGKWGVTTSRKTQMVLGCKVVDGIVSGQLKSCKQYLQGCLTSSWKFVSYSKNGSAMVKAIQKLVGAKADGKMGKQSVKAMQKFLDKKGFECGKADGFMGTKTIKAWQKYINARLK